MFWTPRGWLSDFRNIVLGLRGNQCYFFWEIFWFFSDELANWSEKNQKVSKKVKNRKIYFLRFLAFFVPVILSLVWRKSVKKWRSFIFLKKKILEKNFFGVAGIPRNRKMGVKFWKMIFKENTLRVILRHFKGKLDVTQLLSQETRNVKFTSPPP